MTEGKKKVDYEAIAEYNIMGIPVRLDMTLPKNMVRITNDNDLIPTLQALSTLYKAYYKQTGDVYQHRVDVEFHLYCLMQEYDRYLG